MKTILLAPNAIKDKNLEFTSLVARLSAGRARLLLDESFADFDVPFVEYCAKNEALRECDSVFALGGDGTLLGVAHDVLSTGQPILGFNLGRLGFLAEVEQKEVENNLNKFFDGDYVVENRMMLRAKLEDKSGVERIYDSLNDIVISRGATSRLLDINLYVNSEFVDDYKADGMIVSTPTGSTAYSMSAGGPIVDPSMDSMLITPICPHKLYSRAVLVPADKTVSATLDENGVSGAIVSADGREETPFTADSKLTITRSPHVTRLVRVNGSRFYSVLRKKLAGKDN